MLNINIIRVMEVKNTIRYHFIPTRMAVMEKTDNDKCWQRHGETGTLVCCAPMSVGIHDGAAVLETIWQSLKRMNIGLHMTLLH